MAIGNLLSPDAVKNAETNFAGEALRELNAQIVNEQTITVKSKIDAQTYDATKHFQKSREKLDGNPPSVDEIIANTTGKSNEEIREYLVANKITKEFLKDKIAKLEDQMDDIVTRMNKLHDDIRTIKGGHSKKYQAEYTKSQRAELDALDAKWTKLHDKISALSKLIKILDLPSAKEMAEARKASVTNIDDVPNNPKLKEIFAKLQLTTKMNGKYLVVYINNKSTNFKVFKPEYDQSYAIYPAPAENEDSVAVIFDKLKKDGKHYFKKFSLESSEKASMSKRWEDEPKFEYQKSFDLDPQQTNTDKKVSMINN